MSDELKPLPELVTIKVKAEQPQAYVAAMADALAAGFVLVDPDDPSQSVDFGIADDGTVEFKFRGLSAREALFAVESIDGNYGLPHQEGIEVDGSATASGQDIHRQQTDGPEHSL